MSLAFNSQPSKRFFSRVLVSLVALAFVVALASGTTHAIHSRRDPSPVSKYNKSLTQAGYTLIAPDYSKVVYLVDNNGQVVHTWQTNNYPGLKTELLPNGQLFRTYDTGEINDFPMGGRGGGLQLINWDGSVAWDYQYSTPNQVLHHDATVMPNGHILAITWEKVPEAQALADGVNPKNIDPATHTVWNDDIIEIDPTTNQIVWRWSAFDHLVQDFNPSDPNYGSPADYPRQIDANYWTYAKKPDWLHINAVDYNASTDQIMISAREFNEVWIIDHSTTTAQAATSQGGRYGHGGDLLYRFGNPEAYDHGVQADRVLYLQHDAHWIQDPALSGYGDVMLFNNGQQTEDPVDDKIKQVVFSEASDGKYQDYSSALEFALPENPDGSYTLNADDSFDPAKIVWQYPTNDSQQFYSQFMGSAGRLPNGNTLIDNAMAGKAIEVSPKGQVVWTYTNPFFERGEVNGETTDNEMFRAYKYAPDYPGLEDLHI